MSVTVEISYKIWNDEYGSYVELCPDADALGLFEIRNVDEHGQIGSRITLTPEDLGGLKEVLDNHF